MEDQKITDQARELLKSGKLDHAIQFLTEKLQSTTFQNDIIMLGANFKQQKRAVQMGTISMQETRIAENRIREGVLNLLDEIDKELPEFRISRQESQHEPTRQDNREDQPPGRPTYPTINVEVGKNESGTVNVVGGDQNISGPTKEEKARDAKIRAKELILAEISRQASLLSTLEISPPDIQSYMGKMPHELDIDYAHRVRIEILEYADKLERHLEHPCKLQEDLRFYEKDLQGNSKTARSFRSIANELERGWDRLFQYAGIVRDTVQDYDKNKFRHHPEVKPAPPILPDPASLDHIIFGAKMDLLSAAGNFSLYCDKHELELIFWILDTISNKGNFPKPEDHKGSPETAYQAIHKAWIMASEQKSQNLEQTIEASKIPERSYKRVNPDQAWLAFRKQMSQPAYLTETDHRVNTARVPHEFTGTWSEGLIEIMSAYNFGDASACLEYIDIILKNEDLSSNEREYLKWCRMRIETPEIFEEGMGIYVWKLDPMGGFKAGGIQIGDIICKMNNMPILMVIKIAEELAKRAGEQHLISYIRPGSNNRMMQTAVPGGRSAGAKLAPLLFPEFVQF